MENPAEALLSRLRDLKSKGIPHPEAFERARLEDRIRAWPEAWGNQLRVMLYGGIEITSDVEIRELGLSISSEKKTGSFVFNAPWAYQCKLDVKSMDLPGVLDAIQQLEIFLNSWHIVSGGRAIHYFCTFFFQGADTQTSLTEELEGIKRFLGVLGAFEPHQRDLILRAAWWLRQSHHSFLSGVASPSSFSIYSAYWNAFECLVEVLCEIAPPQSSSPTQKDQEVAEFFQHLPAKPTPADVDMCYHLYVNPGLPKRARHALALAFGHVGDQYFHMCFQQKPERNRLYQIRNDINHANIVEFSLDDRLRVENGLHRLSRIVLNMFFILTKQPIMLDQEVQACHTCENLDEASQCRLRLLPSDIPFWRYVCAEYARKAQ